MKSVHEALTIRAEVMRRFEDLCRFEDDTKLSIVVVGGGPTGVEMAGALAELVRGPLMNDQKHAAMHVEVSLIEAGPRLLPSFSPKLSERTRKDLEKLDVKVLVNHAVKSVLRDSINLKSGEKIPAEITIWAAGVKGEPVISKLSLPLDGNRLSVYPTLAVTNYPNIWGVGDICGAKSNDDRFLPMVAPVAMQQGRFVAEQILRREKGIELKDFKYKDKGSMATIGRHKAVVEVKNIRFAGYPAWATWLFLHLFYLMGGRNRIGTIVDWCWNYFTFDRGNRHIMDSV
jgi:NADH dehydrogenase